MKLIVGLGNPGAQYQDSLHNAGFIALDALAEKLELSDWSSRFKGQISKGVIEGYSFLLLKPQTYMNLSGESVSACAQFFKIPLIDILVLSDDIDLPFGKLRYRETGGHGGHNGLRNIILMCGGNEFQRIRIGVGRPQGQRNVANYVLASPSKEMLEEIKIATQLSVDHQIDFICGRPIQIHNG